MLERRKFLKMGSLGLGAALSNRLLANSVANSAVKKPIVISTWDAGIDANKEAWKILRNKGRALDAVEKGVMQTESTINCCVGLGANPDRDGVVTLDAAIMDEHGNGGGVLAIERIKHPISVARRVMEKTPHVYLVGEGAQQFAVEEGFPLEKQELSPSAEKEYKKWLKTSKYEPVINIEQAEGRGSQGATTFAPSKLPGGEFNHDTIGMVAMDSDGNLSASCTTSGMAFKMHGRVGDSPILGSGLYVDNKYGAAASTGLGEEVIKNCGSFLVVEFMRQGYHPKVACKMALERIIERHGRDTSKDFQVGFIALNKKGEFGGYSIQAGFSYSVCYSDTYNTLLPADYMIS